MSNTGNSSGKSSFLICLLILVIAALAAGYFWYVPTQYELAMAKKEAGRYEEAISALEIPKLINYKDTKAQIAECETGIEYNAAKALAASGRYEEAVKAFTKLGGFLDSKEQAKAAEALTKENVYADAMALLEAGKYEEATAAFTTISNYRDASEQLEVAKAAIKQREYDAAKTLLDNGNYEQAIDAFTALGDYGDAAAQIEAANEGIRQREYSAAKELLDAGEFEQAIEAFTALGDFSDAAAQILVAQERINEQKYDAAKSLLEEGLYDEAIAGFAELGDFADAAEQVAAAENARNQAAYDAAKKLLDNGDYDKAIAAFAALGGFKDAAEQVAVTENARNQAAYDAAKALFDEGQFKAAGDAFTALGVYKDAAKIAEDAYSRVPWIELNASEVSTSYGKSATVTVILHNIDADTLDITGDTSYSLVQSGASYYMVTSEIADLREQKETDGILELVFDGNADTGKRTFTITGPSGDGKTNEYGSIVVNNTGLSEDEKNLVGKVQTLGESNFFFYHDKNAYVLNFAFNDSANTRISSPCIVSIRIENDDGLVIYNRKHYLTSKDFSTWSNVYGRRLLAGIYIQPEDMIEGNRTTGKVFFTVDLPGGGSFKEMQTSASELPVYDATRDCTLDAPTITVDTPVELKYRSSSAVKLTGFSYEFIKRSNGNVDLKISFSGEKTYDSSGNNHSSSCHIGYKLYDPEGYVYASSSVSTTSVATGEKFRNVEQTFRDLVPGAYKLILLDVD